MIHLGLVGYPLEHSLSPVLHQAAFRACGLRGEYALYPVHPADTKNLRALVNQVRTGEIAGLNVTIPHKQAVIPLVDELAPAAMTIGAVNTIFRKDGRVIGENTDFAGFLADLLPWLPEPRSSIILGAGGAARAVAYALGTTHCKVSLASRRLREARELERQFANVTAIGLSAETLREAEADVLVNATPAGTFPNVETCAWPADLPLPHKAMIYDLVYNPPETRLIQRARRAGLKARNGLGMLVEQAARSFYLWTGQLPPSWLLMNAVGQTAV